MRLDRPLDDASRRILQSSVDHAYDEFLHRVGEGRKKSVEDIDKIAQGRVWAGVDAQRIGLVDHLGGLKDATDAAAKLAELGSNYDVDYIEPELSLREELLMQLRSEMGGSRRRGGLVRAARTASSARSIPSSSGPGKSPSSTIRAGCMRIAGASSRPAGNGCSPSDSRSTGGEAGSMTKTDLADCTALELLDLYRTRQASPLEATRAALARIERLNPILTAFSFVAAEDGARERACERRRAGRRGEPCGALDGVPVSIKDLILTRGMPTLRGSRAVDPDQAWDVDAPAAARLREAGAVLAR